MYSERAEVPEDRALTALRPLPSPGCFADEWVHELDAGGMGQAGVAQAGSTQRAQPKLLGRVQPESSLPSSWASARVRPSGIGTGLAASSSTARRLRALQA